MNIWERMGFGKKEIDLDDEIGRAEQDLSRIKNQVEIEKNRYPDEENNTELQRLGKQLEGAEDRLSLLKDKKRHDEEKKAERLN